MLAAVAAAAAAGFNPIIFDKQPDQKAAIKLK